MQERVSLGMTNLRHGPVERLEDIVSRDPSQSE